MECAHDHSKRPHWLREGALALGKLVLASSKPLPPFTMKKLLHEGSGPDEEFRVQGRDWGPDIPL